jgi:hypothetical protein
MEALPLLVFTGSYSISRHFLPDNAGAAGICYFFFTLLGALATGLITGINVGIFNNWNGKVFPLFPESMGEQKSLPPKMKPSLIYTKAVVGHSCFSVMFQGLRMIASSRRPDANPMFVDFLCGCCTCLIRRIYLFIGL